MKKKAAVSKSRSDDALLTLFQAMGYDPKAPMEVILMDILQSQTVKKEVRKRVAEEAGQVALEMLQTEAFASKLRPLVEMELGKVMEEIGEKVARGVDWRY